MAGLTFIWISEHYNITLLCHIEYSTRCLTLSEGLVDGISILSEGCPWIINKVEIAKLCGKSDVTVLEYTDSSMWTPGANHLWGFKVTDSWALYVQCSKKETFRPETGPEFPQNDKNQKYFETNLFLLEFMMENSDHNTLVPKGFVLPR